MFSERLTFHYVHILRKLDEFISHLVHYMVSFLICFLTIGVLYIYFFVCFLSNGILLDVEVCN